MLVISQLSIESGYFTMIELTPQDGDGASPQIKSPNREGDAIVRGRDL